MIVSFLIPTRGRLQALIDGIQSIRELASPDVQVEILVRIDEDDYETLAGRDRIPGEVIVGHRWCGYQCLDIFYNELATKSHGDWLICWSDDTFIKTHNWDRLLPSADSAQVIWLHSPTSWTWAFPAISRKLYELWDCLSPGVPIDSVILEIWKKAGRPIPNPEDHSAQIIIEHRRDENNIRALGILPENIVMPPKALRPGGTLERYIESLKQSKKEIIDDIFASVPGMIEKNIATYLYDMASKVKKGAIVEIGSYYGLSTICIAKGSRSGHNIPVYSVDPQSGHGFTPDPEWNVNGSLGIPNEKYYVNVGVNLSNFKQRLKQFDVDDIVIPLVGHSEQVYKRGWNADIGMLFIDEDPRYNYVKMDMETFGKHVISGGTILFHDDDTPGVRTVINEMIVNNPKYDIIKGEIFSAIVR